MKREFNRSHTRGVSMIEVLVTVLVLSIGMFGVAKLHSFLFQSGTYARERAGAVKLAQEKADDLRSYTTLYTASGEAAFADLADSQYGSATVGGGARNSSGNLVLPSGAHMRDNVAYRLLWDVSSIGDVRNVQVYVAWEDSEAARQGSGAWTDAVPDTLAEVASYCTSHPKYCVQLNFAIYSYDPSLTGQALTSNLARPEPYVGYKPIGVPDVVPVTINVGEETRRETSKPLPELSHQSGVSIRTTIETVDYTGGNAGTESNPHYKTASRTEYATVSCNCQQAGTGWAYPPSYYYWDADRGELAIKVPERLDLVNNSTGTGTPDGNPDGMIQKRIGETADNANQIDSLCNDCCRDHHDVDAPTTAIGSPTASNPVRALFDPDRPTSDYTSGDHKHYSYSTSTGMSAADGNNDEYLEACRFVRVDGYWRIFQDWRMVDVVVMPRDNYLQTASNLSAYQSYITDMIKWQAVTDGGGSATQPAKSSLSDRTLSLENAGVAQLMARATYVDRVYSWRDGAYNGRLLDTTDVSGRTSYYTTQSNLISANSDWLEITPFNEVNVTLLGSWRSSDSSLVTVTNEEIETIASTTADYYGTYSRGRATGAAGIGTAYVTGYILPSNSGLTGGSSRDVLGANTAANSSTGLTPNQIPYPTTLGVDYYDHIENNSAAGTPPSTAPATHNPASYNRKFDTIQVNRGVGDEDEITISGVIYAGNSSTLDSNGSRTMSITGTDGADCETVGNWSGGQLSYSCTVTTGYTGTITVAVASPGSVTYYYSTDAYALKDTATAPSAYTWSNSRSYVSSPVTQATAQQNFTVFGPTAAIGGSIYDCNKNQASQCRDYITLSTTPSNSPYSCAYVSEYNWSCTVPLGATGGHTWAGTVTVTSSNTSKVSFKLTTSPGTCPVGNSGTLSSPRTTGTLTTGPWDLPAAFEYCAGK